MLAHLRTEAYDVYRTPGYPPRSGLDVPLSYEENLQRIEAAKQDVRISRSPRRATAPAGSIDRH
jgi:hypothetical protein